MYKADGLVAIAGALPMEVSGIKALGDFSREHTGGLEFLKGGIHGKDVALIVSGVGGARAYETARSACAALPLSAYISIGLSASLSPSLGPGDIVVGESTTSLGSPVVGRDTAPCGAEGPEDGQMPCALSIGAPQGLDAKLLSIARDALAGEGGISFGGFVAADRVLVKASEKRALAASSGALALDMESASAARAASEAGVPFLAIRAISDALDEDLPVDFNHFTVDGKMAWGPFLLYVLTHPGCITPLMRLGRNSRVAVSNLTRVLKRVIVKL